MKVQLVFSSPLLIGGKKTSSNFIESDDVIKGSVVRAAFAKVILNNCNKKVKNKNKDNWVEFIDDNENCHKCCYANTCKKFSEMKFSYFYPEDTEVIPLTAMGCKTEPKSHGYIDCLVDSKANGCPKCGERVEFKTGLRDRNTKLEYDVIKDVFIKNAINPYTKTSSDGKLYSIETVVATNSKEIVERKVAPKCIYEGYIENFTEEDAKLFRKLRVGGDTTVGLGKCKIKFNNVEEKFIDLDVFELFCKRYKDMNDKKDDLLYFSIKLIADAKLNFEESKKSYFEEIGFSNNYLTTEAYKEIWKRALKINEILKCDDIEVEKVYTEMINYRGYDTSKKGPDKRSEAISLVSKGSVVVFRTKKDVKDIFNKLKELFEQKKLYLGVDNENGFGQYEIYDGGISNANS